MKKYTILSILLLIGMPWGLVACAARADVVLPEPTSSPSSMQALRVLWVNSYGSTDPWAMQIQTGILEELARNGYDRVASTLVWEAVHMNIERQTMIQNILPQADEAIAKIQDFAPDLVIVSDNEAAEAVIPRYPDPDLPFVFCGLSGDPEDYDLVRPNVSGVVEKLYPVQTVEIARAFVPGSGNYIILSDASVTGNSDAVHVFEELQEHYSQLPSPSFWVTAQWQQWQKIVLEAEDFDFIILVSSNFVWDGASRLVDQDELMFWMLENSPVPVFAMSNYAVQKGAIAGLVPSGYEQGMSAGRIVVEFARGTRSLSGQPSTVSHNLLVMNLAAARNWNLRIPVAFPLAGRVYSTLPKSQGGQ
jgi:ABC-type uncharacterized transport system substrate-binding protein